MKRQETENRLSNVVEFEEEDLYCIEYLQSLAALDNNADNIRKLIKEHAFKELSRKGLIATGKLEYPEKPIALAAADSAYVHDDALVDRFGRATHAIATITTATDTLQLKTNYKCSLNYAFMYKGKDLSGNREVVRALAASTEVFYAFQAAKAKQSETGYNCVVILDGSVYSFISAFNIIPRGVSILYRVERNRG